MRALIQRVQRASVKVEGSTVGACGRGLLAFIGVAPDDTTAVADALAEKIATIRLFPDEAGRFDRSVLDIRGEVLVVSQFTLYADTSRGRRPSFMGAAPPVVAEPLVRRIVEALRERGLPVSEGQFGADMQVELVNDGPVTILLQVET